jgi:hypothetical protein
MLKAKVESTPLAWELQRFSALCLKSFPELQFWKPVWFSTGFSSVMFF